VEGISAKDVLGFAIERASALNGLWNLFIAVATAVVGVMASGKSFTTNSLLKVCLSLAFIAFAYVNLDAMLRLGHLREALLTMLPAALPNRAEVIASLSPAKSWQYTVFHFFLDAVVLAAVWFVPWPTAEKSPHAG
jgi:hypothetical protein